MPVQRNATIEGKNMNLLLATDGKKHSEKAINYAFDFAFLQKASLYIVFVVSPKAEEDKEKIIKFGMDVLDKMKQRGAQKGVNVTALLEAGSPYETILSVSERIKADTIIVGTSGKTAIDRVLIGSVSEYVVRNARCTVIVVK
jgi:nucleotide-binding universal stress UspA family protein